MKLILLVPGKIVSAQALISGGKIRAVAKHVTQKEFLSQAFDEISHLKLAELIETRAENNTRVMHYFFLS